MSDQPSRVGQAPSAVPWPGPRTETEPYALADGEGRTYEWHEVVFTMKAAASETGGALAIWDVTTRPGEEPHLHVHDDVDEIFYLLSGSMIFHAGDRSFEVEQHGFVYIPLGTPHTYTIR